MRPVSDVEGLSRHEPLTASDASINPRAVSKQPSLLRLCLLTSSWLLTAAAQAQSTDSPPEALKRLSLEELMNIEVTSVSKRPEKLSETASAIQVITHDDIQRSGAVNLPEALRLASNLEVEQISARQWAISARGLNTDTANELLVLMDGRSLYTPRLAGVFWDVQDTLLEDIDRIEVISGPGATLWGANAVNGVINVTTKAAKNTQGLLLMGGAGVELHDLGGIRYGGALGDTGFDYRVYAKHVDHDGPVTTAGVDAAGRWRMAQTGFRVDGELPGDNSLTVQGDLYDGRFAQNNADVRANGSNMLARWSHVVSSSSDFQVQLYYDRLFRDTPGIVAEDLDTYDLDFQHRLALGSRHQVVWGAGYRFYHDYTYNFASQAYLPPGVNLQLFSGFVQDDIELRKNWHLTLGTKLEHNDYTGFEVQPSGRLAWMISPRETLWTAISRAVRTPARGDRDQYMPGSPPYTRVGNTSFVSEELIAYELGYRMQALERISLSVATFYDDYDKIRSSERLRPPATTPTYVGNGQEGSSYGAELTAEYQISNAWRLRFTDTEIRISLRPKAGSTDTSYGATESFDPKHQLSLRSSLDLPHGLQVDAAFRHVSRISNQNVPAYGELDARLAWRLPGNLELALIGQNLLHAHHAEFGTLASRREIERNVYGKLTWGF